MEKRYPVYATANITVESRDLPHDTIVSEIIGALSQFLARDDAHEQVHSAPSGSAP
jgi:hypothetical protein